VASYYPQIIIGRYVYLEQSGVVQDRKERSLIQVDIDGHPPIPTSSFFQFQFGSFVPSFQVPNSWGRFEALNIVFRDRHIHIVFGVKL
jgi:hypothetical protein